MSGVPVGPDAPARVTLQFTRIQRGKHGLCALGVFLKSAVIDPSVTSPNAFSFQGGPCANVSETHTSKNRPRLTTAMQRVHARCSPTVGSAIGPR
jgi:hypothetical protein